MITHRRTEILTYNPNFDFGAVYTNTTVADNTDKNRNITTDIIKTNHLIRLGK